MLRKLTLALVAAASLSAVALAPTAASAHGGRRMAAAGVAAGHHHHFGHGFGIGYIGGGYGDDGCYVTRRVLTPFGYRCAPSTSADTDRTFAFARFKNPGRRQRPGFLPLCSAMRSRRLKSSTRHCCIAAPHRSESIN